MVENLLDLVQVKVQATAWRAAGTKGLPMHCPRCHATQTPPAALLMCPDMAAHGNDVTKEEEDGEEKRNRGLHLMLMHLLSDYCSYNLRIETATRASIHWKEKWPK